MPECIAIATVSNCEPPGGFFDQALSTGETMRGTPIRGVD